jgi:hypothetical protein
MRIATATRTTRPPALTPMIMPSPIDVLGFASLAPLKIRRKVGEKSLQVRTLAFFT